MKIVLTLKFVKRVDLMLKCSYKKKVASCFCHQELNCFLAKFSGDFFLIYQSCAMSVGKHSSKPCQLGSASVAFIWVISLCP